jgi:hypothetical protein
LSHNRKKLKGIAMTDMNVKKWAMDLLMSTPIFEIIKNDGTRGLKIYSDGSTDELEIPEGAVVVNRLPILMNMIIGKVLNDGIGLFGEKDAVPKEQFEVGGFVNHNLTHEKMLIVEKTRDGKIVCRRSGKMKICSFYPSELTSIK